MPVDINDFKNTVLDATLASVNGGGTKSEGAEVLITVEPQDAQSAKQQSQTAASQEAPRSSLPDTAASSNEVGDASREAVGGELADVSDEASAKKSGEVSAKEQDGYSQQTSKADEGNPSSANGGISEKRKDTNKKSHLSESKFTIIAVIVIIVLFAFAVWYLMNFLGIQRVEDVFDHLSKMDVTWYRHIFGF